MSRSYIVSTVLLIALAGCDTKSPDDSAGGGSDDTGSGTSVVYDDADGDGIIDQHEGELDDDEDADGIPNYLDDDSDGDTIKDNTEAGDTDPLTLPVDSDGDGTPDFLDLDSDNNCISDQLEKPQGGGAADSDGDAVYDYADDDNDGDGVSDIYEIGETCLRPDTDGDGTPDFMDEDSDGDGIYDVWESGTTAWEDEPVDTDGDGTYDYLDEDSDNDGISDAEESGIYVPGEEPRDTDGDDAYDYADSDADGDGLSDTDEMEIYETDPYDVDSDGDGFSDGGEIAAGTSPLDPSDVIDGLYVEVAERTQVEEPFQFELRIQMGDVAFHLDTTCSMTSTAQAMANEFNAMVTTLTTTLPDAEYGAATYDDYAYASYGYASSNDKPFNLEIQVTDDIEAVSAVLTSISIHYGGDGPEGSMEALYQGITGAGYDQDCDSAYDADVDVLPFIATSGDPFTGGGGQSYDSSISSGGLLGGFGYREYALPVLVYATDNYLRDPEEGYGTPGGCPIDAGGSDVVTALEDLGGHLIGISVSGTLPVPQMEDLATRTGSMADTDGDGVADDLLVFTWSGGSSADFREGVTNAIEDLVSSIRFDRVSLEIEGDEWGFVTGIEPEYYEVTGDVTGEIVDFYIDFRGVVAATTEDQLFALTLNVVGDDTVLLDTMDIIILVPGTSD